jgi:hypothetical protein
MAARSRMAPTPVVQLDVRLGQIRLGGIFGVRACNHMMEVPAKRSRLIEAETLKMDRRARDQSALGGQAHGLSAAKVRRARPGAMGGEGTCAGGTKPLHDRRSDRHPSQPAPPDLTYPPRRRVLKCAR